MSLLPVANLKKNIEKDGHYIYLESTLSALVFTNIQTESRSAGNNWYKVVPQILHY